MKDLGKVDSMRLYLLWKNLTIGLMSIIVMMTFSKLLPFYLSPVVSLITAAVLYTLLYNNKVNGESSCMVVIYSVFYCLISYTFVSISLNTLFAWGIIHIPNEFIFFSDPYIPSLIMNPCCFVTMLILYMRRKNLQICVDCRLHRGETAEHGRIGAILKYESSFQLGNLTVFFAVLSIVVWGYYLLFYKDISTNARDWYMFTWVTIIAFVLDTIYFVFRYYNLYLDLKENNEIITPEELNDMTARTYLRYYVICGNHLFIDSGSVDPTAPFKEVIDTPFFTKRTVNGIAFNEVRRIICRMTGVDDGELRFFYGRKSPDMEKHSILRYFYFLDGEASEYPELNVDGEWIDFEKLKYIYSTNPGRLSSIFCADISRLATIILTEKIFDEEGWRKSKIRQYNPSFNLKDVRQSNLDFQDDKWIRISLFNSDTKMYRFKRWLRGTSSQNRREWK